MKDVPGDYYARLAEIDARHWWPRGMMRIEAALLDPWLERRPAALLDAGCGSGAFLAWLRRDGRVRRLAGTDLSPEALEIAGQRVPDADLAVAPLAALPFDDGAFDVTTLNDVLQHVDERELPAGLAELRRVTARDGALLVRTNGSRRRRRERHDWRLYDPSSLRADLERAGFEVQRLTFANLLFSALAELRGRGPRAPTGSTSGLPNTPGPAVSAIGGLSLRLERTALVHGRHIPWGHTLMALAVPR